MAQHITTTDDTKATVTSRLLQTDGTTSNGTISTTIQTTGTGDDIAVTMVTTGGAYSLSDARDMAELVELAADLAAHWAAVATKLAAIQADLNPAES